MNKAIASTILLLFVIMLLTALAMAWLNDIALSSIGGIGVIITLLVLHDMYAIKASRRRKYERIWRQIVSQERDRKLTSDELFRSYDYATRDWNIK